MCNILLSNPKSPNTGSHSVISQTDVLSTILSNLNFHLVGEIGFSNHNKSKLLLPVAVSFGPAAAAPHPDCGSFPLPAKFVSTAKSHSVALIYSSGPGVEPLRAWSCLYTVDAWLRHRASCWFSDTVLP